MSRKIPISFKENDEEMRLLSEVSANSDKSDYVKKALKFYSKYKHLEFYLEQLEKQERINSIKNAAGIK